MRRRLNPELLLETLICFTISIFLFYALISGRISNYVHPRINGYLWFAAAALFMITIFMLPSCFTPKHSARPLNYILFLIPVLAAVLIPEGAVQSKAISFGGTPQNTGTVSQDKGTVLQENVSSQDELGIGPVSSSPSSLPGEDQNGMITISDEQFATWYQDISRDMKKYEGKTLKFKGQVFRMKSFAENEIVPARYAMVCCTADLQPCGILCRSRDASGFKDNDWVWVTGRIKIEAYMGQTMPVCYADKIEGADKAQENYIYFTS